MRVFHSVTVEIAAPPERVWAALLDVESWPRWTASLTEVRRLEPGPFGLGSTARVRQPRLRPAVWRVTGFADGRSFTWESAGPGVLTVAGHRLEPVDAGTRIELTITQTGALAPLFGRMFGRLTRHYLELESAGLKRYCEA